VLVGAGLVGAISLICPWGFLVVKGSQLASNAMPLIAVLFFLLLVGLVQPLLKRAGAGFSRAELTTVYVMMLVGSVVVVTGLTGSLLPTITGVMYYATPENNWAGLFVPNLHPWLVPQDPEAVRLFYEGLPKGMDIPWAAWYLPLATWISFILVFYWTTLCIGVLLRGQWVENERLVYPLTRLPQALTEDAEAPGHLWGWLLRNRLLWLGFAIPLAIDSWNSLHNYHEAFQPLALNGYITLLNGQLGVPVRLNLPVLGLCYLMSLNVAFSIWFFFFLGVAQEWIFARLGVQIGEGDVWNSGGGTPPIMHQQAGALLALVCFVVWTARGHLRKLWTQARQRAAGAGEVLSPRAAVWGFFAGLAGMVVWLSLTGLDFYAALLLVVGALAVYVGLSRIVCEAGLPGCQTPMVPQSFITRGFGPATLGLHNMTGLGLSTVWIGETAANMMNAVVHTLKLQSGEGRADRRLPLALLLAVLVGTAGSIWFTMRLAYTYGGINLEGWYFEGLPKWPFDYLSSVYNSPERSFMPRLGFAAAGAGVMGLLLFLRQRFLWWPLHPLGFPISMTYTIVYYGWLSILLAWAFKAVILRYGGVRAYRRLTPFFLGLALGEFFTASLWVFIDGYFGVQGNTIFNF
jgi:hypothetical protein